MPHRDEVRDKRREIFDAVDRKQAVVVAAPERAEIRHKAPKAATLAGFVERSKKYRGLGLKISKRVKMKNSRSNPFE